MTIDQQRKQLFKKSSKTFSFAVKFLGSNRASKIFKLYEFCRFIDDIADESKDYEQSKIELLTIKNDIINGKSSVPFYQDFIQFINDENIDNSYVLDLIDGVLLDCQPQPIRIKDEDALINYCYHVAGTVGCMMCPLIGVASHDNEKATVFAIQLGIAMQLTNIARDIKEDAENNRIYIPQSWLNIDDAMQLVQKPLSKDHDASDACMRILFMANEYYNSARYGYAYIPLRSRITILIAANLYRAIGQKIEKNNYNYWLGRQFTSRLEKLKLTIYALTEIFRPYFWKIDKNNLNIFRNTKSQKLENAKKPI